MNTIKSENKNFDISKSIPAFPHIIIEINRVIDLPETDYKTLSKIIEKDPAICAKILKIVNSAFYGMPSKIANIPDAVSVLGFDIVHRIAITISIINTINTDHFSDFELLKHLFYTGSISRFISLNFKISTPDDAYVTGLLHDIGKLIIHRIKPEYFEQIRETAIEKKINFNKAEKLLNKYPGHGPIGAFAASQWKFPKKLIDSIRYHHNFTKKAASPQDLILLMISNYIDNNKLKILNSGININKINPEISELLKKPLMEINYWLPELITKTEDEFKNFAENLK
ncbi:MAG: HDOD domain-containing protein [Desulforegulaceae bacterium]|nr:HDOD domain-containing protein [Desulforegulaceae bacterium]